MTGQTYRCAVCHQPIKLIGSKIQRYMGLRSRVGPCCYRVPKKGA